MYRDIQPVRRATAVLQLLQLTVVLYPTGRVLEAGA